MRLRGSHAPRKVPIDLLCAPQIFLVAGSHLAWSLRQGEEREGTGDTGLRAAGRILRARGSPGGDPGSWAMLLDQKREDGGQKA